MKKRSNVLIIIPAFNEEKNIYQTVNNITNITTYDYIVINDGSKDKTKEILERNKFNYLDLVINLGIGGAMQTGYQFAYENGYDYAIQLDADGQHNPKDLDKLLSTMIGFNCDMVIGSRFVEKTNYKGSLSRRLGIYYFYLILKWLTGIPIKDPTSGYRVVNRKVIKEFQNNYPIDYPEVEVLVDLSRKRYKIKEIKVDMESRLGGNSSITPIKSIYYLIKVTLFLLIRRVF